MDTAADHSTATPQPPEMIGRVATVSGAQVTVELNEREVTGDRPTFQIFIFNFILYLFQKTDF